MEMYVKAEEYMLEEIKKVMSSCFNEPRYVMDFFFKKRLNTDNCYVCIVDRKIVSLLNVIPHKIKIEREIINGVYIYGACTLRKYRNRGYMRGLLNYTHNDCKARGYECTFLVPEVQSLESFYEKLGYKNIFKLKRIELTNKEILDTFKDANSENNYDVDSVIDFYKIEKLRMDLLKDQNSVIYNENDIDFANSLYKFFSLGGIIHTDFGYGICAPCDPGELKIRDFICKNTDIPKLLKRIYNRFPNNKKYIIETTLNNQFFKDFGKSYFYGMIYPLSSLCSELVNNIINSKSEERYPYLGISLE